MPQVFKIGAYLVYFWLNEGMPLEPIHVHVAEGTPIQNGTKIWITQKGRCIAHLPLMIKRIFPPHYLPDA